MPTTLYGLVNGKAAGNTLAAAEVNTLSNTVEEVFIGFAEMYGEGVFLSTQFNGAIVVSALSVDVSAGWAFVTDTGGYKLIHQSAVETITGLDASSTLDIYLLNDGTLTAQDTSDPAPAGSLLLMEVVTNGTEVTSIDDNPSGRINHGLALTEKSLSDATPTALTIGGAGAAGTSDDVARADHSHPLPAAAAAVSTSNTNGAGAATTFARSDHTHAIGSSSTDGSTVEVSSGAIRIKDLGVTTGKLAANVLSADATGRGKMQDGFLSADSTGRAKVADGFVNAAKLASDAVETAKILNSNITVAKLENAIQDAIPNVNITVGTETTDTITVTLQFRDLANNNLSSRMSGEAWLADSANAAETSTVPDGGWSCTTGYKLSDTVTNKRARFNSDANGTIAIAITHSGAQTYYLHFTFDGPVHTSSAITFA